MWSRHGRIVDGLLMVNSSQPGSEQPDIHEKENHGCEETEPDLPADTAPFCHDKHPIHRSAKAYPCLVECIVHLLCEGRGFADFVADCYRHLQASQQSALDHQARTSHLTYILQRPHFSQYALYIRVVLAL
jgi:hypothetical protein